MTDFTHHTPRLLTDEDAAADLAGVERPVSSKEGRCFPDYMMDLLNAVNALEAERDELASRVRELEGALWGCIAAIERTHHCTEADRLASADAARAAISAKKVQP